MRQIICFTFNVLFGRVNFDRGKAQCDSKPTNSLFLNEKKRF